MTARSLHLVLGPPKSASTWAWDALAADPALALCRSKEVRYFNHHADRSLDWYRQQFRAGANHMAPFVDVCHDYFQHPGAAARAGALRDEIDVTAAVAVREPVARTWSDFHHRRRQGRYRFDYPTALERDPELLANSTYADALVEWRDALGADRVRVVFFDDLTADPIAFWRDLYGALDLPAPATPPAGLTDRANPARGSRFPGVTRILRSVGAGLQRRGLHGVTHAAKRHPVVERLLYTADRIDHDAERRAEGDAIVRHALAADVARLRTLVDHVPPGWFSEIAALATAGEVPR